MSIQTISEAWNPISEDDWQIEAIAGSSVGTSWWNWPPWVARDRWSNVSKVSMEGHVQWCHQVRQIVRRMPAPISGSTRGAFTSHLEHNCPGEGRNRHCLYALNGRRIWIHCVCKGRSLSGWIEGRVIKVADAKDVAKYIYKDVICRHGCLRRIILDRGSENLNPTKDLLEHYRIDRSHLSI